MSAAEKIVSSLLESVDETVVAFAALVADYTADIEIEETEIAGYGDDPDEQTVCVHGGLCSTRSDREVKGFLLELVKMTNLVDRLVHLEVHLDPEMGRCPKELGKYFSFMVHFKPMAHDGSGEMAFSESIEDDPVADILREILDWIVEARRVCDPSVADFALDLETAHKFAVAALETGEHAAVVAALRKAQDLFSEEDEMQDRIQGALQDLSESIAVDLDGTLAKDTGWKGTDHIGEPVKPMLDLVKKLLDGGEEVVIFTARAHDGKKSTKDHIRDWLKAHDLPDLEITNEKRPDMEKFFDDKAVAVAKNKGVTEASSPEDFSRSRAISQGHLTHPGYQDGWQPITPEIADFVGHDFGVCCEGSYRGPDRGFVYGESGKPRLIALVQGGRVSYVAGWKPPQGSRAPTPEERHMANVALEKNKGVSEALLLESPRMPTLKAHKTALTPEERAQVLKAKATWNHGKGGKPTPAIWKAVVRGTTWYASNTHRCYQADKTLKAAIRSFFKTVEPSA